MLGTLHRYVLVETLKVFVVALAVTMCLLTMAGGVKEAMRGGLPLLLVARVLPYVAVEMLRFTVPGCLLFAIASTVGRMASHNELVAIKAAGISSWRCLIPLLVLAYLLSLSTYWLYDLSASWARRGMRQTLLHSIDDIAYSTLSTAGSFRTNDLAIVVDGVHKHLLMKPRIDIFSSSSGMQTSLVADTAELRIVNDQLLLRCENATVDIDGVGRFYFPERLEQPVPMRGFHKYNVNTASPAEIAANELRRQIARERSVVKRLRKQRETTESPAARLVQDLESHELRLNRLLGENQRRLSNGFACFAFALIGIPVAAWRKTSDSMSTFFVCFMPILVGYYPLLMVGETLVRSGIVPPIAPWLANACAFGIGGLLMRRHIFR